jgi:hypothetical protein
MLKKIILYFLCILFLNENIDAQKNVTYQNLYWTRLYAQVKLGKKWALHSEWENRRFLKNNHQHHFITHQRIYYKTSESSNIALGFTYSRQSPHDENAINGLIVPELRLVQEANYSTSLTEKGVSLQQRLRIDERFIRKNDGKNLLSGYDFNFRFRYRLQLNYKVKKTNFKASDELMVNAGKNIIHNVFDQNRLYFGIEQTINKHFSIEIGYLKWFQQRNVANQFFDRNIIRTTISTNF